MPFTFQSLEIPDVILIQPKHFADPRGWFMETYRASVFAANGIEAAFVQDNCSVSKRGVLRGLHFQRAPKAQGKLVRVVQGKIYDVAVDLREGSPTYGRWVGEVLSAENRRLVYVPPGFAHGFCVLGETAAVVYKVTAEYAPDCEGGVRWDDPQIGVRWPIADPVLSDRDARLPLLGELEARGLTLQA
jgi:dTDP-4-dehydrorhamnose 3,5-epimerase